MRTVIFMKLARRNNGMWHLRKVMETSAFLELPIAVHQQHQFANLDGMTRAMQSQLCSVLFNLRVMAGVAALKVKLNMQLLPKEWHKVFQEVVLMIRAVDACG